MDNDKSALKQLLEAGEFRRGDDPGRKTMDKVFDTRTLSAIYDVMKKFKVDIIDYPVSTGKESVVFKAVLRKKNIAIKIYKMSTLGFNSVREYIEGDYRFEKEKLSRGSVVDVWARKEFVNLKNMTEFGVRCPAPIGVHKNVLLMQYLGTSLKPSQQLRNIRGEKLEKFIISAMKQYRNMVEKCYLIHADLSEYNILCYRNNSYIIDVGQSVPMTHPMAKEFLKRDINNMIIFSKKAGISESELEIPEFYYNWPDDPQKLVRKL
ncbi:MAG: serine protein kinase RIO [Thermoplasmataceae archaeon]